MISFIKRYSGFFLLLAGIIGLILINGSTGKETTVVAATTAQTETTATTTTPAYVVVDIKGAVYFPGCYRVLSGSRIGDVIDAAGGTKISADLDQVNRSALVSDEMVIYIPVATEEGESEEETATETLCVDVKGSVASPGIYYLPSGSRVGEALAAAGGPEENADLSGLNLSACLTDEMVVYVPSLEETEEEEPFVVPGYGYVAIKGEVLHPGLYYVSTNSTVADVINLAGGLTLNGSVGNLDVEAVIVPGTTLQILSESAVYLLLHPIIVEEEETETETEEEAEESGLVNINTASVDELDTLYGIGPVLAQAIIDYRAENGDFESIEDIMLVSGIKTSVYENIKDDITV